MRKGVQRITRYVSILANSRIGSVNRYDEEASKAAGRPKDLAMLAELEALKELKSGENR